jgi:hypothetical protein
MLCARAVGWLSEFGYSIEVEVEAAGVLVAVICYMYGFSKIVKRNIARIHSLPERVSIFAFTAVRGYIMIVLMVSFGIILRTSMEHKYYLSVPYTAMGGALLIGSFQFYRQYFLTTRQEK